MKSNYLILGTLFLSMVITAGCNINLRHIDNTEIVPINPDYTFRATFEKTWHATVDAVIEFSTIATLDKENSFISTDTATIDANEMDIPGSKLSRQTYTFSYDIRLDAEDAGATKIGTRVQLFHEHSMNLPHQQTHIEQVENFLRNKLYQKICNNLFPSGNGDCNRSSFATEMPVLPEGEPVTPDQKFDPKLQSAQKALGSAGYNPGPPDGLMGQKTRKAMNSFQQDNDLTITWSLDSATYDLLTRPPQYKPDTPPQKIQPPSPRQIDPPTSKEPEKVVEIPKPPPAPSNKKPTSRYITTDDTDLLQARDLFGAEIIDSVPAGTLLNVLSKNGEFYKVKYKGNEGYIYLEFIEKVE